MNVKGDIIYTPDTARRLASQKQELVKMCKHHIDDMIKAQHEIVRNVFNYKRGSMVHIPVAFTHIIQNIQNQQNIQSNSLVDITPLEAFKMIENVMKIFLRVNLL